LRRTHRATMTIAPLEDLSLHPKHHVSALWWLGLLYRRPRDFGRFFASSNRFAQLAIGGALFAHSLPYIFLITIVPRLADSEFLDQCVHAN